MFHQERRQLIRTAEVGGHDGEESPGTLTRLWYFRFVAGGLFHQLTVDFVTKWYVFVTMLKKKVGVWFLLISLVGSLRKHFRQKILEI